MSGHARHVGMMHQTSLPAAELWLFPATSKHSYTLRHGALAKHDYPVAALCKRLSHRLARARITYYRRYMLPVWTCQRSKQLRWLSVQCRGFSATDDNSMQRMKPAARISAGRVKDTYVHCNIGLARQMLCKAAARRSLATQCLAGHTPQVWSCGKQQQQDSNLCW